MGADRGGEKPLSPLSTCRSANETVAQMDPLNHQQLHLGNQSLLGLELHLSQLCYVGLHDPNFRLEEEAGSFTPNLPLASLQPHRVNQSSCRSTGEILPCREQLGSALVRATQLGAFPPHRDQITLGRILPGTLQFPVSGSLLKTCPGEERML